MKKVVIINGPNLNLLGKRETDIYGIRDFESFLAELKAEFPQITFDYFQSNTEGEIINALQDYSAKGFDIIINPAGYSHTSVAIADALATVQTRCVEVHISNIYKREEYRHVSLTAARCIGVLSGFGFDGYRMAAHYLSGFTRPE